MRPLDHLVLAGAALLASPTEAALPRDMPDAAFRRVDQELLDAWATGNAAAWREALDPGALYTNEDGELFDKDAIIGQIAPPPVGVAPQFAIIEHQVRRHGDWAVTTHLDLETERVFGQILHPRFRTTETWLRTPAGWRIVTMQLTVLSGDPPAQALPAELLDQYVGRYILAPSVEIELRREGHDLILIRGQQSQTMKAEGRDLFFIPGRPRERRVFVRDAQGAITGFNLVREGRALFWRRAGAG